MTKTFRWEPGAPPPHIEAHSLAKLQVVGRYVYAYCNTLNQDVRRDQFRLDIVDGFAGGGVHFHEGEEIPGSPLVMLEACQRAERELNEKRSKPLRFDVKYHFVEKDPRHFEYLRQELQKRGHLREGGPVALYEQEFGEALDQIIADIGRRQPRSGRSIFLLDQFGYTDADLHLVQRIGRHLPNAEVILTISVDAMLNFATRESIVARLDSFGIPKNRIDAALRTSSDTHVKAMMQRALPQLLAGSTLFDWFTPFFIRPAISHWELWFAHFSRNVVARNVMLDCHWRFQNTFAHYGDSLGLNMLGFEGQAPSPTLPTFTEVDRDVMNTGIEDRLVPELNEKLEEEQSLPFAGVIQHFGNRTAATVADFNKVVVRVRNAGEIQIVGPDGRRRDGTNLKILRPNDRIVRPPQLALPFGSIGKR